MKLKIIDGLPFISTRSGNRESIQTPAEVTNDAHRLIAEANQAILGLRNAHQEAQQRIEAAILSGEDTAKLRAEQSAIRDEIAYQERDQLEAFNRIGEVSTLLDANLAETIRKGDKARLNQLLTPFNNFTRSLQS